MRRHDAAVKLALRGFLLQLGIKSAGYQPTVYIRSGQTVVFKVNIVSIVNASSGVNFPFIFS